MSEENIESWMKRIIEAKAERRKELARLPIEQKINIIVQMQKILYPIRVQRGQDFPKPWDIPDID